nr:probable pectinesterase/pectinesterase inhibitor 46 [Ipomoea batatas]
MGSLVDPRGWLPWVGDSAPDTIFYGEFQNFGPGAVTGGRVKWKGLKVNITSQIASRFSVKQFIQGDKWIPATGARISIARDHGISGTRAARRKHAGGGADVSSRDLSVFFRCKMDAFQDTTIRPFQTANSTETATSPARWTSYSGQLRPPSSRKLQTSSPAESPSRGQQKHHHSPGAKSTRNQNTGNLPSITSAPCATLRATAGGVGAGDEPDLAVRRGEGEFMGGGIPEGGCRGSEILRRTPFFNGEVMTLDPVR